MMKRVGAAIMLHLVKEACVVSSEIQEKCRLFVQMRQEKINQFVSNLTHKTINQSTHTGFWGFGVLGFSLIF